MIIIDITTYAILKRYIDESLIGIGALKGAPCEVQGIHKADDITTVELKWEDTTGAVHTQTFDIADGISVVGAEVDVSGDLIINLSDGSIINCGKVNSQFTTLPTPSAANAGAILQYVGETTHDYTKGFFYECRLDGTEYKWIQKNVQPGGGGGGGDIQITDLPTPSIDEFGNIYQYIGMDTSDYLNGCFYKCVYDSDSATYKWIPILVEDGDAYEDEPIDFNHDYDF